MVSIQTSKSGSDKGGMIGTPQWMPPEVIQREVRTRPGLQCPRRTTHTHAMERSAAADDRLLWRLLLAGLEHTGRHLRLGSRVHGDLHWPAALAWRRYRPDGSPPHGREQERAGLLLRGEQHHPGKPRLPHLSHPGQGHPVLSRPSCPASFAHGAHSGGRNRGRCIGSESRRQDSSLRGDSRPAYELQREDRPVIDAVHGTWRGHRRKSSRGRHRGLLDGLEHLQEEGGRG